MKEVNLSAKGIVNLQTNNITEDFVFYVDEKEYHCNRVCADFISPNISRLHLIDPTINSYSIKVHDTDGNFNKVIQLMNGHSVSVDENSSQFLMHIGMLLGNNELVEKVASEKDLSIEQILEHFSQGNVFQKEVDKFASILSEVSSDLVKSIDPNILYQILTNENLKVKSESALLDVILDLIDYDKEGNLFLLDAIHFENISNDKMQRFIKTVTFEDISPKVWDSLCQRMLMEAGTTLSTETSKSDNSISSEIMEFPFEKPFEGIIAYLTKKFGGNVNEKGVVLISAETSLKSPNRQPPIVADFASSHYYLSLNSKVNWIKFHFVNFSVTISAYTLKSLPIGPRGGHLKSWVIDGSNDGENWTEIDSRLNNTDLNHKDAVKTFQCKNQIESSYIRIRQIGENHAGNNIMGVCAVEFYGKLCSKAPSN
ncbi:F5/8 type C domain containing protein [Histomonas meleagridis]|uniref:F5/8 type C domain containing protein n=1 Tax=Histomonas meleagridis TaxID=135588 RepID=UPI00355A7A1A|nr:F5/8 type C domain containing protein [Histomonas meleagridis]KAH0803364.1 F5/8 type C domain containing protein [Histomonas meleagridis]